MKRENVFPPQTRKPPNWVPHLLSISPLISPSIFMEKKIVLMQIGSSFFMIIKVKKIIKARVYWVMFNRCLMPLIL
jgi:hypothetical protein